MKSKFIGERYPYGSAGRRMTKDFFTVKKNETIGNILQRLKKEIKNVKTTDYIYVTDENEFFIGFVSIKDILSSSNTIKVSNIIQKNLIKITPETDIEKVADLAVKHNMKAIPVVEGKKLAGVIPTEEILSSLNIALRKDILHLAGIHKSHLNYENTLEVPLFLSIVHRLPWLIIGLIGIVFAAIFMGIFESVLETYLILAFFVPAIVYMSDALGTQYQTLFIRDLAILGKKLSVRKYILRQMVIGLFLGLIISFLIFLVISLFWKQPYIALVIAGSMFITLLISSFTALMITFILNHYNFDPALGGGPFATIVSDVISIVVYFAVALLFLGF